MGTENTLGCLLQDITRLFLNYALACSSAEEKGTDGIAELSCVMSDVSDL